MTRLLLAVVGLSAAVCITLAQVQCSVTRPFSEDAFASSFRRAYLDLYGSPRGHNLVREGKHLYERASFEKVNNRGDNCMQRYEYTESLCKACVRKLGWRADEDLFRRRSRRADQRSLTNALRRRVCEEDEPCQRPPRASPSPSPSPQAARMKIVSSDNVTSPVIAYHFALVAEASSTRLTYSVEDLVTGFPPFGDTLLDYMTDTVDSAFFDCAANMLDAADLGNLAAAAIRESCYDESSSQNFNNRCANDRLSAEICDGLSQRGCTAQGDPLNSQCVT